MSYGDNTKHRRSSQFVSFLDEESITRLCTVATLSLLVLLLWAQIQPACAEQDTVNAKASLTMLQQGEVMTTQDGEIIIDNTRYPLMPTAVVADDEGRPRDLKEFVPGTQIRFHVRNVKIDQLVMMLPR